MSKFRDLLTLDEKAVKAGEADARVKLVMRKTSASLDSSRDEVENARAAIITALNAKSFSMAAVLEAQQREAAGLASIAAIKEFQEVYLQGEKIVNAEDVK